MKSAIRVKDLSYSYGDGIVLKKISFSITKGAFYIIIGPNGSGKTTLMRIIAGILKPDEGKVNILGRLLTDYSRRSIARIIAFVPQMEPVDFPFVVSEVVLMGRSPHQGMLGLERKHDLEIANQAMEFTGVEHLSRRRLDQLSGGERQRVFIARALCQGPQIILLDEPTASLDLRHQVRVMDLMERLKQERGITVIMVSHDVNLAAMYCDQLLLLKEGQVLSQGSPNEVLTFQALEKAYGCTLLVDKSPLGDFPRVTLVPEKSMKI